MIKKLTIHNFRSLGARTELELGKLNFLVGVNGSGKSNVLHALTFVREAVRMGLPGAVANNNGIEALRLHSSGHPRNIMLGFELWLGGFPASYGFEIAGDRSKEYRVKREWGEVRDAQGKPTSFETQGGLWEGPENLKPNLDQQSLAITAVGGDPRIKPLWDFLANMMVYSIYPDILREPQKFSSETPMKSQGDNWISILHQPEADNWKNDLVAALAKLTGDIEDIKVTEVAGYLIAQFRHKVPGGKDKKWFDAGRESDGTLRVAGLLTGLLQEPTLPVIGIEEPELTVHPGALPLIFDFLREASLRSQILVTTHSPILLDFLSIDDAQLFVVQRRKSVTTVMPLSEDRREAVRSQLLTLGEMMISGDLLLPQLSLFED